MERRKLSFFSKENKILAFVILFLAAFVCILPMFIHQSLPLSHDIVFHLFYAYEFKLSLDSGLLYPRWALDSVNGYGSPTFVFYSPLSYYLVSLINFVIPSLIFSMVIAIWLSFFLSGLAMFAAAKRMFGWPGSIISAVVYQTLPFHLIDLYGRGTFAELFSFVWFPIIILFIHEAFEKKKKTAYVGLSLSYAGLILTHLMSGFIFTFVIAAYLIYKYALLKQKKPFMKTLFSVALGLGISSFYLIPVIFERKFVHIEYILNCSVCDYRENFLFTLDKFKGGLLDFYLGLHVGVVLEVLLCLFMISLISKDNRQSTGSERTFFVAAFLSAFFLTTPLSRPIWASMPLLPTLQFPWRWVPVMEVSLCFLVGSIFSNENGPGLKAGDLGKRAVIYVMLALLSVSFLIVFKSRVVLADFFNEILNPEDIKSYMVPTIEYAPIWSTIEKIRSQEKHERISVISGAAQYSVIAWKPEERVIDVKASGPVMLRIATFYYPGWEATVDGRSAQIMIEKDVGTMLIDMPHGEHMLELQFKDTPLRHLSKVVSLLSCLTMIGLVIIRKKRGPQP